MWKNSAATAAILSAALLTAGCDDNGNGTGNDDDDSSRIGNTTVVYDQIERLANPLVSEVFVEKREHGHFNTDEPADDPSNFRDDIVAFITGVAGRDPAYATMVATALTPDMLVVRMDKAPNVTAANVATAPTVGWLTQVLDAPNGYGGRKLDGDDAVDKALSVTFGSALGNSNNVSPGLVTDNVPDPRVDLTTFPYVAAPNP